MAPLNWYCVQVTSVCPAAAGQVVQFLAHTYSSIKSATMATDICDKSCLRLMLTTNNRMQNQTKNLQEPGHDGGRKTRQAGHCWVELRGTGKTMRHRCNTLRQARCWLQKHKDRKKTQGTQTEQGNTWRTRHWCLCGSLRIISSFLPAAVQLTHDACIRLIIYAAIQKSHELFQWKTMTD